MPVPEPEVRRVLRRIVWLRHNTTGSDSLAKLDRFWGRSVLIARASRSRCEAECLLNRRAGKIGAGGIDDDGLDGLIEQTGAAGVGPHLPPRVSPKSRTIISYQDHRRETRLS